MKTRHKCERCKTITHLENDGEYYPTYYCDCIHTAKKKRVVKYDNGIMEAWDFYGDLPKDIREEGYKMSNNKLESDD